MEAALTLEPGNEELLKLKSDLAEVINLTNELLAQSKQSAPSTNAEKKGKFFSVSGLHCHLNCTEFFHY